MFNKAKVLYNFKNNSEFNITVFIRDKESEFIYSGQKLNLKSLNKVLINFKRCYFTTIRNKYLYNKFEYLFKDNNILF